MRIFAFFTLIALVFTSCTTVQPLYKTETITKTDQIAYLTPTIVIEDGTSTSIDHDANNIMRKSIDSLFKQEVKTLQVTNLIENYSPTLHEDVQSMFNKVRSETFPEVPEIITNLEIPQEYQYLLVVIIYRNKQTITNMGNYSYYVNEPYVGIIDRKTGNIIFLDSLEQGYYLDNLKTSLKKFKHKEMKPAL